MGIQDEVDEQIMLLTDVEKELERCQSALRHAEHKIEASGISDGCQMQDCHRPVDWWCHNCENSLCQRWLAYNVYFTTSTS